MGPGQGSLCLDWLSVIVIMTVMMIMIVMTLTGRTGDGGTALVLGLLHHTVLTNWLDKWAHPRKKEFQNVLLAGLQIFGRITSKNT